MDHELHNHESLEAAIERAGSPVELLRNSPFAPFTFPVKPEFTNWRDEQRAWRESCALLDQSHHMADLFVSGPDALRLFSDLGINNFSRFAPNIAKQFIAASHDGFYIGDGVLFYLDENEFDFVTPQPAVVDWIQFNAEVGGYNVTTELDENSADRTDGPPRLYRYELQGPNALEIVKRASGGDPPEVKFFHVTEFEIGGHEVRALRHGMAGQPGFEFFGPWDDGYDVLEALVGAGQDCGLVRAGSKAYAAANLESGWIPSPTPAIFSGEQMRAFREWRKASRAGSLGGSVYSADIADYYVTPYDLGYGPLIDFDHEFPGREALQRIAEAPPRTKVTLVWDKDDVMRVMGSHIGEREPFKYIDFPKARYSLFQSDMVLHAGEVVGISMDCGYLCNDKVMVSLATIDVGLSEPGTEVSVVWGESPNSDKPQVESHVQTEIRATVAPAPYVQYARAAYRG